MEKIYSVKYGPNKSHLHGCKVFCSSDDAFAFADAIAKTYPLPNVSEVYEHKGPGDSFYLQEGVKKNETISEAKHRFLRSRN